MVGTSHHARGSSGRRAVLSPGGSIDEVDDNVILHRAGTAHFPYMPKIVLLGLYSVYAFVMLFCMGNGRCLLGGEQSGRGNVG